MIAMFSYNCRPISMLTIMYVFVKCILIAVWNILCGFKNVPFYAILPFLLVNDMKTFTDSKKI